MTVTAWQRRRLAHVQGAGHWIIDCVLLDCLRGRPRRVVRHSGGRHVGGLSVAAAVKVATSHPYPQPGASPSRAVAIQADVVRRAEACRSRRLQPAVEL